MGRRVVVCVSVCGLELGVCGLCVCVPVHCGMSGRVCAVCLLMWTDAPSFLPPSSTTDADTRATPPLHDDSP